MAAIFGTKLPIHSIVVSIISFLWTFSKFWHSLWN